MARFCLVVELLSRLPCLVYDDADIGNEDDNEDDDEDYDEEDEEDDEDNDDDNEDDDEDDEDNDDDNEDDDEDDEDNDATDHSIPVTDSTQCCHPWLPALFLLLPSHYSHLGTWL